MIGDHIRALVASRWLHAIDCGDETVLHLVADPAAGGRVQVRRSFRPELLAGAECVERVTHRERVFTPAEVVARAFSRASDPALAAMFRGPADFAVWCKTGRLDEATGARPPATLPELPAPAGPLAAPPTQEPRPAGIPAKAAPARRRPARARGARPGRPRKVAGKHKTTSPARRPVRKAPTRKKPARRETGARKGPPAAKRPARATTPRRKARKPTRKARRR